MSDSAEQRAPLPTGDGTRRFSAFISYNHADERFAKRLHRQLETYRLPHRLTGASGAARRLKAIFRDSDELAAAYDLTTAVREAIAQSDFLIVVCSAASAKSVWVGREIELYRSLHGDTGILAVIAEGEVDTAFHPALHGRSGGPSLEPLAADFRREGGGRRLALLKLVAVIAGVRLDELLQRDLQRQVRRITAVAAAAVAGVAVVAGLAVAALSARADAESQRNRASGLGAFMATDLHAGLKSAGRLDLQMAADKAALDYYRGQDLSRLAPAALGQRAKVLQAAGEDNERHGDLKTAQAQFEEARRTTAALLAAKPNDPQRIFDQAQSEYWVGFINWRNGDGAGAKAGFEAYARLAARLVRIDPRNDAWLMETAYAANNLGILALRQAGRPAEAQTQFIKALRILQVIAPHKPGDPQLQRDIATALAWLADSQRINGDVQEAMATREAQRKILADLLAKTPSDVQAQEAMLGHDLAVARIDAARGEFPRAIQHLEAGRQAALVLVRGDPDNKDFAKQARMFELFEVRTWLAMPTRSRPPAAVLADTLGDCKPRTPALANDEIGDFCAILLARLRAASGDDAGALAALAPVRRHASARHDVLTAHWGLNLGEEVGTIQVADNRGKAK
ncbi:TIR domain-containing protein [Phenylobacterium sp.]|uniref:TIR domain-containing protein n=1 Tax=Phenylobacterium sp. TaxID=1871053 RepID=UPI002E36B4D8|nr:TIR domain-containing protein [Phenylobacterium sp.]HEX4709527.1 TIR domain-containing protein [Phenylobacterium sp.]